MKTLEPETLPALIQLLKSEREKGKDTHQWFSPANAARKMVAESLRQSGWKVAEYADHLLIKVDPGPVDESVYLLETPARISFSGGRTSGYLLYHVVKAFGGKLPDDVIVTFANTGREYEETLKFVKDCQDHWGVRIRWIEYARDPNKPLIGRDGGRPTIGCHGFREVTFETASRNGEPFSDIIRVKADFRKAAKNEVPILPNPTDRWCSAELKQRTMDRFMRSLDEDEYTVAVGIRADEAKRALTLYKNKTSLVNYTCPLVGAWVTQEDVQEFWKRQPFDLGLRHDEELGTYQGNCDGCFLKRSAKLVRIATEAPDKMNWWVEQEEFTGQSFRLGKKYSDLLPGRTPLPVCGVDEDLGACLCTD